MGIAAGRVTHTGFWLLEIVVQGKRRYAIFLDREKN